jgi:triosephosphate isomerase (TIM)
MKRCVIAGNWKMFKTRREAVSFAEDFVSGLAGVPAERELLLFPPFTAIAALADRCRGTRVGVGGQNLHPEPEGAFTGEISARMLLEAGASHVLIGHSERRQHFGESDNYLARKLKTALGSGLAPVFCLGETLEQREAGRTEEVLRGQVEAGLGGLTPKDAALLCVAYEPIWAIGTGKTATAEQARQAHVFLRRLFLRQWGESGGAVPLLYGGSVKAANAGELLRQDDVDGLLVGGASLEVASFLGIAAAV